MINQSNAAGLKGISRAILTAVIAFVVVIGVFASSAFASLASQYNVEIRVDNNSFVVTTNETEPIEILSQANVTLSENDRLDITSFVSGEGGVITVDKLNNVNIEYDGVINSYSVYADTVEQALEELKINIDGDSKLNYSLSDGIVDGMVITIHNAKHVWLTVDGKTNSYAIYQGSVSDLLALAQVELGEYDYTEPSPDTQLEENMKVNVFRVEYEEVREKEEITFNTTKQEDDTMVIGSEQVITKGVKGEAEVLYKVMYVNGKQTDKSELSRSTLKQPVAQVVKVGTKDCDVTPNGVSSLNGYSVGQKLTGRYTHYCACKSCTGSGRGVTASGKKVYNGMQNPHYIACNWLPFGSVISVDGVNYTVVDRGGSGLSSSGRIDIFTPEGHSACYKYGTGSCDIEIIRLGW